MKYHPVFSSGRVAVITGAASGIGLATARRCAGFGMHVVLADLAGEALDQARAGVEAVPAVGKVLAVATDVSQLDAVQMLRDAVLAAFDGVDFLINNAGIEAGGGAFDDIAAWRRTLETNLWGVIHGIHVFAPTMADRPVPSLIVNTGSKQGITTPPGNTAYNVSKAGIKVATEGLQHELRNRPGCRVTAHLLIPGFTFTGITGRKDKPPGAWTADQVVDALLEGITAGRFYIVCPDNEVTAEMDRKRMRWAAQDVIEGRPPLSRWHPDFSEEFKAYMARTEE